MEEKMSAKIIDGAQIAADLRADIAKDVEKIKAKGVQPTLAVILVGNDPASQSYVKGKTNALHEVGMNDRTFRLPETTTQDELLKLIKELNADKLINGILVQLPLPKQIDPDAVIEAINPEKDVDGFHPVNVGKLLLGHDTFIPCTPHGVIHLLKRTGVETKGAKVVIVGRSNIVGKPLSVLMMNKDVNATVTVCHSGTKNLAEVTKEADILVAAMGKPQFIKADMIKKGAVVIDRPATDECFVCSDVQDVSHGEITDQDMVLKFSSCNMDGDIIRKVSSESEPVVRVDGKIFFLNKVQHL